MKGMLFPIVTVNKWKWKEAREVIPEGTVDGLTSTQFTRG